MESSAYSVRLALGLPGSRTQAPVLSVLRIVLAGLIMVGLLVLMVIPDTETDRGTSEAVSHVVQAGESLWSIAVTYTPEAGDVRQTLTLIRDTNGLSSDVVLVGDAIAVPVGLRAGRPITRQ